MRGEGRQPAEVANQTGMIASKREMLLARILRERTSETFYTIDVCCELLETLFELVCSYNSRGVKGFMEYELYELI